MNFELLICYSRPVIKCSTSQYSETLGSVQPISVFTVGAMHDIWGSVDYTHADPFSCSAPRMGAQQGSKRIKVNLLKPIGTVGTDGRIALLK